MHMLHAAQLCNMSPFLILLCKATTTEKKIIIWDVYHHRLLKFLCLFDTCIYLYFVKQMGCWWCSWKQMAAVDAMLVKKLCTSASLFVENRNIFHWAARDSFIYVSKWDKYALQNTYYNWRNKQHFKCL